MITKEYSNYLAHHGIEGQQWGKRRFQNKDGSLTPEGKKRYLMDSQRAEKENQTAIANARELERMSKTGSLKSQNREISAAVKKYRELGYSDAQIRTALNSAVSQIGPAVEANKSAKVYEQKMRKFVRENEHVTLKDIRKHSKQLAKEMNGNKHFLSSYEKQRWNKATKD